MAGIVLLSACSRPSPEQELRQAVAMLQASIEERDSGDLRQVLAEDFVGEDGLDREGAVRLAQLTFVRNREIGVHPGPLDIRISGDHATVRFDAALTGGSGSPLPETAQLYVVETGWRLEDGDWRLTSATWQGRL
jgi:hypothetical protein